MKKLTCFIFAATVLLAAPAFSQGVSSQPRGVAPLTAVDTDAADLTRFDLNFPGGTPGELVAAIQKAMGGPLNAIVANEYAAVRLPQLKMNGVTVAQLFTALGRATTAARVPGSGSTYDISYSFRADRPITNTSVWSFYYEGYRETTSKVSRLYLLTPFIERGLSVDDVTTAVQTNWKMSGITPAALSFHKETGLLIAVGDPNQLQAIEAVLAALRPRTAPIQPPASSTSASPVPAAAPVAPRGGRG